MDGIFKLVLCYVCVVMLEMSCCVEKQEGVGAGPKLVLLVWICEVSKVICAECRKR